MSYTARDLSRYTKKLLDSALTNPVRIRRGSEFFELTKLKLVDSRDLEVQGGGYQIPPQLNENRVPAEIPTKIFEVNVGLADKGEYPCCKLKKPCKHWQWDGVKEGYVNSLSGRVIEA